MLKLATIICILISLTGCAARSRLPLELAPLPKVYGITHIVQRGETLWRISKTYNVDLDKIVRANRIPNRSKIIAGQTLVIPDAKKKKKTTRSNLSRNSSFIWPVKGKIVSYFKDKQEHLINKGVNIEARPGADVLSSRSGIVTFSAENLKGYGKTIIIDHNDGFITVYTYNSKNLVKLNDRVNQGTVIAKVGGNGRATLHFEIRRSNKPQNPLYYLP